MARRRCQEGYVFKRGKKRKVWGARWREMLIGDDGKLTFIRKAEVLGSVSELTKGDAKQKLAEKLDGKQKSGEVDTTVTFSFFVKQWWKPSILPTYKPSTGKQAELAIDNYLVPKFGEYRLSDISRADVQAFFGLLDTSSPTQFTDCTAGCEESSAVPSNGGFFKRTRRAESNCRRQDEGGRPSLRRNSSRSWFKDFRSSPAYGPAGDDDFDANRRNPWIALAQG